MSNFIINKNLYIGATNNAGAYAAPFSGVLDEIIIFNKALSAEEVTQLYEQENPPPIDDFHSDSITDSNDCRGRYSVNSNSRDRY